MAIDFEKLNMLINRFELEQQEKDVEISELTEKAERLERQNALLKKQTKDIENRYNRQLAEKAVYIDELEFKNRQYDRVEIEIAYLLNKIADDDNIKRNPFPLIAGLDAIAEKFKITPAVNSISGKRMYVLGKKSSS